MAKAQIDVDVTQQGTTYTCEVTVREGGSHSHHTVTLKERDYQRLAGDKATPEVLVRESFRFLLEREPKESILRSFDLTVINRYFPAYERTIKQRL